MPSSTLISMLLESTGVNKAPPVHPKAVSFPTINACLAVSTESTKLYHHGSVSDGNHPPSSNLEPGTFTPICEA